MSSGGNNVMNSYEPFISPSAESSLGMSLSAMPSDPLLGLSALFHQDNHPNKVDLGVGVYKDEQGLAPVMNVVKQAERLVLSREVSKAYIEPRGDGGFIDAIERLLFGDSHKALKDNRIGSIQTPGGSCALRIAADFILRCNPEASLWLPNPTWVNHEPLLGRTGLILKEYPYYNADLHQLEVDAMMDTLKTVPRGDVVLLHGCCHNPCGADLTSAQWQMIADIAQMQGFTVLVDIAYQGFGESLDADASGLRLLTEQLPMVLVTASCSKNFAIYRERIGSLSIVASSSAQADICLSQMLDIVRGYYFVPPSHGAAVVKTILMDSDLAKLWRDELSVIRVRIASARQQFDNAVESIGLSGRFSHIAQQKGMFSFLGLTECQVNHLRQKHSVYMAASSRINLSGINKKNLSYLIAALLETASCIE